MKGLFFRDEGEGEPLLLLHGLGAQSRVFNPLFERRGARRLIAVDLPGTANSLRWAEPAPQAIAQKLLQFLDERGVQRFQVFGHSFGGLAALALAVLAKERLTRLTVASVPAFGLPGPLKRLLALPLAERAFAAFGRLPPHRPAMQAYLRLIWGRATPAPWLLDAYEEVWRTPGFQGAMLDALRAIAAWTLPHEALRALPVEKQVLHGEVDPLVTPVQGEKLSLAIGAQLRVLNDVGHAVPEEAPGELASLILR